MFDVALLFIIAFAGGIITIIGFFVILGRRISEPKKALQLRIDNLDFIYIS
ncbi:hypothetical protein SC499_18040 [Peribacillus simplex]|uniref:hypothetical protein n=1 Tax=Peribacillus simplex TaxID=1478 RepID=UPI000AE658D2|nr:hypothetical protein [Peribacillus simplex]MDW7616583.1 hypothetical protein [Peribacillus simplex]